MNLNATLFAQVVVFLILAWFCKRFIWPPLINAIDQRTKKIADGLAAADKGRAELDKAHKRIEQELSKAHQEGQEFIAAAEKRAKVLADEVKADAKVEAERIIAQAKAESQQLVVRAREDLRAEVAILAVKGAEQILKKEIDKTAHADLLAKLKTEL